MRPGWRLRQTSLVGCAVQLNKSLINGNLIQYVHANEHSAISVLAFFTAFSTAFAVVAALVAVPQLAGLIDAGGGAGRDRGAAHSAVLQVDLHLHGGVAPLSRISRPSTSTISMICFMMKLLSYWRREQTPAYRGVLCGGRARPPGSMVGRGFIPPVTGFAAIPLNGKVS